MAHSCATACIPNMSQTAMLLHKTIIPPISKYAADNVELYAVAVDDVSRTYVLYFLVTLLLVPSGNVGKQSAVQSNIEPDPIVRANIEYV